MGDKFKSKSIILLVILLVLSVLTACTEKMSEEEYKDFKKMTNGKIVNFLEIAINEVKEPVSNEEREKIKSRAKEIKDEIIEELDEKESSIPKESKDKYKNKKEIIEKELEFLTESIVFKDESMLKDRDKSLEKLIETTKISFEQEAYNADEWIKMTVDSMRKDIQANIIGLSKEPKDEEFKNGPGAIVYGYANLDNDAIGLVNHLYLNRVINISESLERPYYMSIGNWYMAINDNEDKELYNALLLGADIPIVAYIIKAPDTNNILSRVGMAMEYRYTLDYQ